MQQLLAVTLHTFTSTWRPVYS